MPFLNFPFLSIRLPDSKSYAGVPFLEESPTSPVEFEIELLPQKTFVYAIPYFSADYTESSITFKSNFIQGKIKDRKIYITDAESMPDFWSNIKLAMGTLVPFFPCIFLHGSAGRINEELLVFSGVSGSGKSTAQELLHTLPVNADSCLIDTSRSRLLVNPFEPLTFFSPTSRKIEEYCLKKIFFIERQDVNRLEKITNKADMIAKFMENVTLFSKDRFYMEKLLDRIEEFSDNDTSFFRLSYCKNGFKEWFLNEIQN